MRFGARYFDEAGYISGGAGTYRLRDKATGEVYDFSTGLWAAAPVTPNGTLTEDSADAGYYRGTNLVITAWGTRRISYSYVLTCAGKSPQAREEEVVVLGGVESVPVPFPVPAEGSQLAVLFVRTPAGAIPEETPLAFCFIYSSPIRPPADSGPVFRTGAWDPDTGAVVWTVPSNAVVEVACRTSGVAGRYQVAEETLVINTATPLS